MPKNPSVFAGAANASNFAYGTREIPGLTVDLAGGPTAPGVATLTVSFPTVTLSDGTIISPLSTTCPITVGSGANAETVTPTAVNVGEPGVYQSASFTATFANAHGTGDPVESASGGLQEAANYVAGIGGLVLLDPTWFAQYASHAAGLTALVTFKSVATSKYTVLDYSGVAGALSYAAASGSVYASTTHILY